MTLLLWCDRVIRSGFYLLFLLVPLILTPVNYELFEFNKMMVTYAATVMIMGAWLTKMVVLKKVAIARTPLDIPLALFFISQLIASVFSMDPHVSWFGYYSRFNGGMWSVVSYILLYYAFVSNFTNRTRDTLTPDTLIRFLKLALASATLVALYGVAERMGIDKHLWVQDVQNRVFSTLGQPNWLAAYLVALIPLAAVFALNSQFTNHNIQQGKRSFYWSLGFVIWTLTTVLFFLVLLFTRSRSGLMGFAVADIVFWGLIVVLGKNSALRKSLLLPFVILHSAFFIIVFVNGTHIDAIDRWFTYRGWRERVSLSVATPQGNEATAAAVPSTYTAPLLETGGTESATIRKYVWQGALNAWRSSPKTVLIGTGTETFAFAFFAHRPKEHNLTSEWDFVYNKAHNEYLNYLATTGIFGLGSYLIFIGTFIIWFIKTISKSEFLPDRQAGLISQQIPNPKSQLDQLKIRSIGHFLLLALFSGWLSILVTNFFGFSVVIMQLFLFLFPAMVISVAFSKDAARFFEFRLALPQNRFVTFLSFTPLLVSVGLLVLLFRFWYADRLFAAGYRLNRANREAQAYPSLTLATTFNPFEPLYYDELGTALSGLTIAAAEEKDATKAADFAKLSIRSSDKALAISPNNVNIWKTRTKIFYSFSGFDPQFNQAAIDALTRASALSPNDPKILYNLAILYGRASDNAQAIEILKRGIELKPNYRDAYYALHIFYREVNQPELARATLQEYLTRVDPNDQDFQKRIKE